MSIACWVTVYPTLQPADHSPISSADAEFVPCGLNTGAAPAASGHVHDKESSLLKF